MTEGGGAVGSSVDQGTTTTAVLGRTGGQVGFKSLQLQSSFGTDRKKECERNKDGEAVFTDIPDGKCLESRCCPSRCQLSMSTTAGC